LLLGAWWALSHALVGLALTLSGAPWPLKCVAVLGTAVHAVMRRPRSPQRVILKDGIAELPDSGLVDLSIGSRSRYTWWWVHLRLRRADDAVAVDVVLLADQLDEETWRALQAELRRARRRAIPRRGRRHGDR
jgi:hypothetical protein